LNGCATVKPYYADKTKNISTKNYSLNKIMQSYVGDIMVDVKNYKLKDSGQMELLTSFKIGNAYFASSERFSIYGIMEINKVDYKVLSIRGYSPFLLVGKDNRIKS
jgi:uncharacterized membrane protein